MATDERDPKINPQAGDVLVDGDYTYEVTSRAGSWIVYKATEERTMPLGQWHMLRARSTVVTRGAEDKGHG